MQRPRLRYHNSGLRLDRPRSLASYYVRTDHFVIVLVSIRVVLLYRGRDANSEMQNM